MRKIKSNKAKKIIGAVLSSLIFGILFLIPTIVFIVMGYVDHNKILYLFSLLFVIPFIAIIINLIKRIEEINGGEEDEASKY